MAKIAAICISDVRGIQKHEIPEAFLKKDWGIEGDAHAGNWHRQVSLLSVDSVAKLQEKLSFELKHGAFAENILVVPQYLNSRIVCVFQCFAHNFICFGNGLVGTCFHRTSVHILAAWDLQSHHTKFP